MAKMREIRFWAHPCHPLRATCPNCLRRVRPKDQRDNRGAIWRVGYHRNGKFRGISAVCRWCWPEERARTFPYLIRPWTLESDRLMLPRNGWILPPWLTFELPVGEARALAADHGVDIPDPLILADWLDEHGHPKAADNLRTYIHLKEQSHAVTT